MDVVHRDEVVKCPGCEKPIHISVGRWPGGINDSGGWVLKCTSCSHAFPVNVKNPDDASRVASGATILASWDNEIGNQAEVLAAHGIKEASAPPERLLLLQHGEPDNFYDLGSRAYRAAKLLSKRARLLEFSRLDSSRDWQSPWPRPQREFFCAVVLG